MVILTPPRLGGPDTPDHLAIAAFRSWLRDDPAPRDLFGLLRVELLDPAGRRVSELFSGEAGPGTVWLTWDGADSGGRELPSGVYFLRATLDGETATRRVHLIR